MKRLLNIFLLLTFQMGYLEWGKDKSLFIFQAEAQIIQQAGTNPETFFHPFILVPLCGLIMILYTIFQRTPGRVLSLAGLACLSIFILLLFFIGLLSPNFKILGSTIPFIATGLFVLRNNRKQAGRNVKRSHF